MAYELSDVFIGDFPITQSFGARPEVYGNLYNLKGHNGVDFGCVTMTPVIATADGFVSEEGFDSGGYGNYLKVVHSGFLSLYGHLNDIAVKQGDKVVKGQLLGHSNNSGFSSAPHLHFGIAPCDTAGNKTETSNGYSGYIDPMGDRCHWTITNPTAPVSPSQLPQNVKYVDNVTVETYAELVTKASNWDVIATHFNLAPTDVTAPKAAEQIVIPKIVALETKSTQASAQPQNTPLVEPANSTQSAEINPQEQANQMSDSQKTNFIVLVLQAFKDFMLVRRT